MIFLPYADDIRDLNSIFEVSGLAEGEGQEIDIVEKEDMKAAQLLVKNLSINFDSRNFENPSI